jgi:hypothetical protein
VVLTYVSDFIDEKMLISINNADGFKARSPFSFGNGKREVFLPLSLSFDLEEHFRL